MITRKWFDFPEYLPPEPGKYVVTLQCEEREWTSIKCWEKVQVHEYFGMLQSSELDHYGHIKIPNTWILGMEFKDTKVLSWTGERL